MLHVGAGLSVIRDSGERQVRRDDARVRIKLRARPSCTLASLRNTRAQARCNTTTTEKEERMFESGGGTGECV